MAAQIVLITFTLFRLGAYTSGVLASKGTHDDVGKYLARLVCTGALHGTLYWGGFYGPVLSRLYGQG